MTVEEAIGLLEKVLTPGSLNKVQEIVFRQSWIGLSYTEIAKLSGYDIGYIKDTGSKLWQQLSNVLGKKVTKNNFQLVLKRYAQENHVIAVPPATSLNQVNEISSSDINSLIDAGEVIEASSITQPQQDWGEAINVSVFYGRTAELLTLQQWILQEHCRLVTILGMGGIGKTTLTICSAKQIQEHFDYVIWRSLRHAPPLQETLSHLIAFLSNQQEINLPQSIEGKILQLLGYLRSSRCLIILDNFESILQSGSYAGQYRAGYEGYGQLISCIGEIQHQSTIVLTSREKPSRLASKESKISAIRCLQLSGLQAEDVNKLFNAKDLFFRTVEEGKLLTDRYAGNPLALQIVAAAIKDVFDGSISNFIAYLKQGKLIFDDIRNLLERQFNRLADLEKEVMYWLAIEREEVTFTELQSNIFSSEAKQKLVDTLSSLRRRSLIEVKSASFTQQPVVMEYVSEKFVAEIYNEIVNESLNCFICHPLIKSQAKNYIKESQTRLLLEPLIAKLNHKFRNNKTLEAKLNRVLLKLRTDFSQSLGYGYGNILNLLRYIKTNLTGYNFSRLMILPVELQDINLHINFTGFNLAMSVLSENLSNIYAVAFSPDGKLLAIGSVDGNIKLWHIADGQQLLSYKGHSKSALSIAFSPDSKILASCSSDHTVKLWNVSTGECIKTLQECTDLVYSIVFSIDGQIIAGSGSDGTVQLWNISDGKSFKSLNKIVN